MKAWLIFILLINTTMLSQTKLDKLYTSTDDFLRLNVMEGNLDYKNLKDNSDKLNQLVNSMKTIELSMDLNKNSLKSFWINAYNITVIKSVVENYPIDSPLDVEGFFDSKKHSIAGKEVTLDQIEKEILIPIDHDARIHFAINCAAVGCPELINEAYKPELLEEQLNERAKAILNNKEYVKVDDKSETIYLNEIFKWYQDDFKKNAASIFDYINKYRENDLPSNYNIDHIRYNWELNDVSKKKVLNKSENEKLSLQKYTPAVLLLEGEWEIKLFNNIYTQTAFFNGESEKIDQNGRSTYSTLLASYLYGVSEDFNIGFDVWLKSVHNDTKSSSPLKVFGFKNNSMSRTEITGIGPKVKFDPFPNGFLDGASIQSTLLFPLANELEGMNDKPFLDYDAYLWLNQFFYDQAISDDLSFFGEIDTWLRVGKDFESGKNSLQLPVKGFLSYYPSSKVTFYGMVEFSYRFGRGDNTSYYNQSGIGAKYQLFNSFEVEGLITQFFFGKNAGAGSTFNLGVRIVN